jgi:hypothetical protein
MAMQQEAMSVGEAISLIEENARKIAAYGRAHPEKIEKVLRINGGEVSDAKGNHFPVETPEDACCLKVAEWACQTMPEWLWDAACLCLDIRAIVREELSKGVSGES